MLRTITGIVTRALPTTTGVAVKIATSDGSVGLTAASDRRNVIEAVQAARLSGATMTVSHTSDGRIVMIGHATPALAA